MLKIVKKSLLILVLCVSTVILTACVGDNLKTDVVQEGGDSSSEVSATVEESPVSETAPAEENQVVEEASEAVETPVVVEEAPSAPSAPSAPENPATETVVTSEPVTAEPVAEPVTPPVQSTTTQVSASGSCDPDVAGYVQPLIASNSVSKNENQSYSISGPGCDEGVITFQKRNGDVMPIVAFGLAGECRFEFQYTYHFSSESLVKEKSRSQCVNQDWSGWKTY